MATPSTVLNMVFKDAGDMKQTISLNHADDEADGSDVNALMTAIVSNGSVFSDTPISKVSAQLVTTSVRDIAIV